jgi:hypothetical protein
MDSSQLASLYFLTLIRAPASCLVILHSVRYRSSDPYKSTLPDGLLATGYSLLLSKPKVLWQGHLAQFAIDGLNIMMQPSIRLLVTHSLLKFVSNDSIWTILLVHATADSIVHFILSPLHTARARYFFGIHFRLAIQLPSPPKKYSSLLDCLKKMVSEESLAEMWFGSASVANWTFHFLSSVLHRSKILLMDFVFESYLQNSLFLLLCDSLWSIGESIVLMPLNMVRRRLQVQSRALIPCESMATIVPIRTMPYVSIVDCLQKIWHEDGQYYWHPLGAFYHGFRTRLDISFAVNAIQLLKNN